MDARHFSFVKTLELRRHNKYENTYALEPNCRSPGDCRICKWCCGVARAAEGWSKSWDGLAKTAATPF
jgi:hypothetical protein